MSKKHHPSQETENGMVRGLQNRHVQLIAIAGTIGTGLFLGAGRSLSLTGPSIILVYMLTGAFMYLMMRAIGEMLYMDLYQLYHQVSRKRLGLFFRMVLLGLLGIFGNGRDHGCFQLCPALVSKLASLADSNCLFSAFKLCKLDRCEGFWRG